MNWWSVIFLVLYFAANLFLYLKLRKKPAPVSSDFVPYWIRPWIAIFWMWGPTLWFLPGFFSIALAEIHIVGGGLLSFFLPLSYFMLFFIWLGLFSFDRSKDRVFSIVSMMFVVVFLWFGAFLILQKEISLREFMFLLSAISMIPLLSIALIVVAPLFLIPLEVGTPDLTRESIRMVIGHFTSYPKPVWRIEDGQIQTRVEGNPSLGTGPGCLMTEPENLVVLKDSSKITRLAGPGVVLTQHGESPLKVVDLRNQTRSTQITAMTKDGVEVRFTISSRFRINPEGASVKLGEPWPYDEDNVWRAVLAESVEPTGQGPLETHQFHNWEDLPLRIAIQKAKKAIGFYTLDQLYSSDDTVDDSSSPSDRDTSLKDIHQKVEELFGLEPADDVNKPLTRLSIGTLVQRAVAEQLQPIGFEILGGGISSKIEPISEEVTAQRVENWKERFIKQIEEWDTEIQELQIEKQAQIRMDKTGRLFEIVETINEELREIRSRSGDVAYWIVDSLIEITADPRVQKMLPDSSMRTLEDLSTWDESDDPSTQE